MLIVCLLEIHRSCRPALHDTLSTYVYALNLSLGFSHVNCLFVGNTASLFCYDCRCADAINRRFPRLKSRVLLMSRRAILVTTVNDRLENAILRFTKIIYSSILS